MLIPDHWAEVRLEVPFEGRTRVIRRWGWSTESLADARRMARERVDAAVARLRAGEWTASRLRTHDYLGDDGEPIREEVLARHPEGVVTRNSYGARCLNVADVFIADLDQPEWSQLGCNLGCLAMFLALSLPAIALAAVGLEPPFGTGLAVLLGVFALFLAWELIRSIWSDLGEVRERRDPGLWLEHANARIDAVVGADPGARLRVYRTPNGLRVIALHRRFDPRGPESKEWMEQLRTDRRYAQLTRVQGCFRARLTAKPWRIGVPTEHLMRRRWPIPDELRGRRQRWVEEYEAKARGFAACRFERDAGTGGIDPHCRAVVELHDALCSAGDPSLPIA